MEINEIDSDIIKQISNMAIAYSDVRLDKEDTKKILATISRQLSITLNDPEENNSLFAQAEVEDVAAMCLLS